MIILGVLVIAAAAVFGVDLLVASNHPINSPTVFSQGLGLTNTRELFVVGVITGAGLLAGVALLLAGIRHRAATAVRRHRQHKEVRVVRQERDALRSENEQLHQEIDVRDGAYAQDGPLRSEERL